ncbi:sensor protein rcsC [Aaosphaeria arxii CBS 175.79]|uniref:histidine kinase n=1 Tax=Aaosphaeria arxii CBS 175.79 TaxID=1450172 RepID=A0A6A5XS20_9PLEO|nr:sensor protein rcsC [Aaosphaeria arxii CBS 175.79]KAF2015696.1 sensor protein rcsC [Aaosphaeria arxii CBS 175.79]
MGHYALDPSTVPPDIVERQTVCFSSPQPGMVVQHGEAGFKNELLRLYSAAESNAAEELVKLKDALRKSDSESFWPLLTEGLATIADAQYAFVSKRILADDDDLAVEMPPIGEPGSCLMGAAFYLNDGHGVKQQLNNFKYHAYSCPCAYMRHDKIFIIPDRLNDFIVNNPNPLVVPGEAYLGIPLFADGKCFAHFGVMWSEEGASRRALGWGYLELLFHSLEDLILERVLEGKNFAHSAEPCQEGRPLIIPHESVSVAQSLKPYARSLSHELRTPMQGVVGMLDVIMATVKEAAEAPEDFDVRDLLETLKGNIEVVQDSSRRAVEAADNIVHAYDMNMGVPETPLTPLDKILHDDTSARERHPDILVAGNNISMKQFRGTKRKRSESASRSERMLEARARVSRAPRQRPRYSNTVDPSSSCKPIPDSTMNAASNMIMEDDETCLHDLEPSCDFPMSPMFASEQSTAPGLRNTDLREVVQYVFNDALKVGGRPDSAIAHQMDFGEEIEVQTRSSNGQISTKRIEWMVSPDVPKTIQIDEKDLAKMISCVVLNAIKFTDNGTIQLNAALSAQNRYIVITVKDTGAGIPAAFLPSLFKPFAREDNSTTRESEGLGLGLLVAKGLARKLGGDLLCVQSHVSGPQKGSEFEMRVPLTPGDVCSRSTSPFGSRSPSMKDRMSVEADEAAFSNSQQVTTPPLSSDSSSETQGSTDKRGSIASSLPEVYKTAPSLQHLGLPSPRRTESPAWTRSRSKSRTISDSSAFDHALASRYPLNILVVEDNKINRKLLITMLRKLGYTNVSEAFDGNDAVDQMRRKHENGERVDVILMDLWMPLLDGFQASDAIMRMKLPSPPTILAVSADITEAALERAAKVGMKGFMTKPFQIRDLEKLITQYCDTQ